MRAFARGGRAFVTHNRNPALSAWRDAVHYEAAQHIGSLIEGPVGLSLTFRLIRPANHHGTGKNKGKLKPSAPHWPVTTPDLDKLARAVLDALTGVAYRDDAQVVRMQLEKTYAWASEQPGVLVRIEVL